MERSSADVLGLEPAQIAQHLGLAVIELEHRMGQEVGRCAAGLHGMHSSTAASNWSCRAIRSALVAKTRHRRLQVAAPGRLVEGNAEMVGVDHPQVDAGFPRLGGDPRGLPGDPHQMVSKKFSVSTSKPSRLSARRPGSGSAGAPGRRSCACPRARDRPHRARRSPRAAPGRCRCCWSPSRGGYAARGSAAPCARRGCRHLIDRDADDPSGHGALVVLAGREERRVRTAVAHGHAEALGTADRHVCAKFAGRGQERKAHEVGRHDGKRLGIMQLFDDGAVIAHFTA